MFKVELRFMYATRAEGQITNFRRHLLLPFVPFVGLELWQTDDEYSEIAGVAWLEKENRFVCRTSDELLSSEETDEELESMCADYLALGWQVEQDK